MGIFIGIAYVILAIMFFNYRRDYDELLNECYLISLAAFTVLIFKGWNAANILWIILFLMGLYSLFFNNLEKHSTSSRVWMVLTALLTLSVFLSS